MEDVEELILEMIDFHKRHGDSPFPYEEIRRLRQRHPLPFRALGEEDQFEPDLNEHLMMVAGLASGGVRRWVADPALIKHLAFHIRQDFFSRYPQYSFLMKVDISEFPQLQAELNRSEILRMRLVNLVELVQSGGSSAFHL